MNTPKLAVVLGGGGARGPYQIGVWRALRELGIDYHIVTGSSVGALNGALMVQGDYKEAKRLWENLDLEDVFAKHAGRAKESDEKETTPRGLRLDPSPLEELIRSAVDEDRFRASPVDFGLVATRFPLIATQLVKSEIPEGKLVDYLMASSTYFPFFRTRVIDGKSYIDGAFNDNLPAELALRCGAEHIIAVDLAGRGVVHRFKKDVPVTYIRSRWALGQIMDFDSSTAGEKMTLGYHDALQSFGILEGSSYAFYPGETRKNTLRLRRALQDIHRKSGVSILRQYRRLPRSHVQSRYHDKRFYRYSGERYTLGMALTTVAEIAGELLGVEPYQVYTLERFNAILLERLEEPVKTPYAGPVIDGEAASVVSLSRSGSRRAIRRFHAMLRASCERGRVTDAMWGLVAVSPREFLAAYYLLAIQTIRENQ